MKLTENQVHEIRNALFEAAKTRKMNRWDALNFVAGYVNFKIDLFDAMILVNVAYEMDLIKA